MFPCSTTRSGSTSGWSRHQLAAWIEARGDYARIHRSAIVNLARVREFKLGGEGMVAVLMDGQRCRLSRRGRERVAGILSVPI
jgi:DNA-binding LytR/AlgR family response regulator